MQKYIATPSKSETFFRARLAIMTQIGYTVVSPVRIFAINISFSIYFFSFSVSSLINFLNMTLYSIMFNNKMNKKIIDAISQIIVSIKVDKSFGLK